ncbi:MAG: hypothetical protein HYX91_04675 [Chloroflexi bacterium]|nr:hypothetical protein [Chloroflexota bacterium]
MARIACILVGVALLFSLVINIQPELDADALPGPPLSPDAIYRTFTGGPLPAHTRLALSKLSNPVDALLDIERYVFQPYPAWASSKRQKSGLDRTAVAPFRKALAEEFKLSHISPFFFTRHTAFSINLESSSPPGMVLLV